MKLYDGALSTTRVQTWTADEAAEVFSLAGVAQPAAAVTPPADGLTLEELVAIGRDAGFDPKRVEQAALEVQGGRAPKSFAERVLGAAPRLRAAVQVSTPPSDEQVDRMVELLEAQYGTGEARKVAGVFTWTCAVIEPLGSNRGDPRQQQVVRLVVRPRTNGAVVQLEQTPSFAERWTLRLGLGLSGAMGVLSVGGAGASVALGVVVLAVGVVAGTATLATLRALGRRRTERHRALFSQVLAVAQGP